MEGIGLCLATAGAMAVMYLTYLYFKGVIDMKKIIVMVLGIVAAMSLCACGETADPILGTWTATLGDESLSMTFLDNNDVVLEEAHDGDVYDTITADWGATNDGYSMYDGYDMFDIEISGATMTVEGYDSIVFEKE